MGMGMGMGAELESEPEPGPEPRAKGKRSRSGRKKLCGKLNISRNEGQNRLKKKTYKKWIHSMP